MSPDRTREGDGPAVMVREGSPSGLPDATVHDRFRALARTLPAESRVVFRDVAADGGGESGKPFVLWHRPGGLGGLPGRAQLCAAKRLGGGWGLSNRGGVLRVAELALEIPDWGNAVTGNSIPRRN